MIGVPLLRRMKWSPSFLLAAALAAMPIAARAREPVPDDEPEVIAPSPLIHRPGHYKGNMQFRYGRLWRILAAGNDDNFRAYERAMSLLCGGLGFDGFIVEFCHARGLEERVSGEHLTVDTQTGGQSIEGRIPSQELTVRDEEGEEYQVKLGEQDITLQAKGENAVVTLEGEKITRRRQYYLVFGMRFGEWYGNWWSSNLIAQIPAGLDVRDSTIRFSSGDEVPKYKLEGLIGVEGRGEFLFHLPSQVRKYAPLALGAAGSVGYGIDQIEEVGESRYGFNLSGALMLKFWPPQLEKNW